MASQHDTPELTTSKSFSFSFHVLRCASIPYARLSCESGYRRHLPPDISEFLSRCYQRAASLRARFPSSERYRAERRCCEKGGLLGLVPLLRAAL